MSDGCPCGNGAGYEHCCRPLHLGRPAASPEALMRSRYSAFCLSLVDYLLASWHPATRPGVLDLAGSPRWSGLAVLASAERGDSGQVHFRAVYPAAPGWGYLEEQAEFVREAGRWYYLGGTTREGQWQPGRNEPCPCGSGRKYKVCCRPG
jgi:SEC-C motif-containing protein